MRQVRDGQTPDIPNDNFDTGKPDPPGVYFMNDDVHAQLVEELAKTNFKGISPALRAELTAVLFRSKRAIRHQAQAEGMGQAAGRVAAVRIERHHAGRSADAARLRGRPVSPA